MKNQIKAFVETITSAPDMYGNTYSICTVINPKSGDSIRFQTTGENGAHMVCRVFGGWGPVHHSTVLRHPIRNFNQCAKGLPYDHQVDLYKLFNKRKPKEVNA